MTDVLHVDHSMVLGGAERSVLELARAQNALGDRARVAVGREGPFAAALRSSSIPVVPLGWRRRYVDAPSDARLARMVGGAAATIDASLKLRRVVHDASPDVVQAHTRKAQLVASLGLVGAGTPLVWHLRDDVPRRPALRRLLRAAIGRADHAVAISTWLAGHYAELRLLPRSGRIDVVPSSVDPAPLSALPTPWLDGDRAPVLGFVGQIADWKAPDVIVDLAEQLADRPDVRFVIVGDVWFTNADRGYGDRLAARVRESTAAPRIERLGTRAPAEAFAALDILVHTSREPEPFGRVVVEAMMARRPVVGFRRGAVPEILGDGTGALADGFDAAALARAVRSVIDDPAGSRAMAERAAASARRYAPDRIAATMADVYARTLG
ncbi:MAG TPA: glycosyltransferase family 4 protein [Candidatus Limnocylindrales bacterium]|jgi:glycosyltransferase involved in cell wall biosynthesis